MTLYNIVIVNRFYHYNEDLFFKNIIQLMLRFEAFFSYVNGKLSHYSSDNRAHHPVLF